MQIGTFVLRMQSIKKTSPVPLRRQDDGSRSYEALVLTLLASHQGRAVNAECIIQRNSGCCVSRLLHVFFAPFVGVRPY